MRDVPYFYNNEKVVIWKLVIWLNDIYSHLTDYIFLIIIPREDLLYTDVFQGFTLHIKQFSGMVSKTSIKYWRSINEFHGIVLGQKNCCMPILFVIARD